MEEVLSGEKKPGEQFPWEATLTDIMKNQGWTAIPGNGAVFLHGTTRAIMVVYVDDMLRAAPVLPGDH